MTDELRAAANRRAREEKKEAFLRAILDRYLEQFRALQREGVAEAAHHVHITMDQVLERDRSKDQSSRAITCGRGCDHCCKVPVEIFPHEAALLLRTARAAGIALDRSLLERQSRYGIETWNTQPAADKACVFLGEDGACKVYAFRPNACRKLFVVTEPDLCDAEKHRADSIGRWISWESEILASAALELFGATLMPAALLAAMNERELPDFKDAEAGTGGAGG